MSWEVEREERYDPGWEVSSEEEISAQPTSNQVSNDSGIPVIHQARQAYEGIMDAIPAIGVNVAGGVIGAGAGLREWVSSFSANKARAESERVAREYSDLYKPTTPLGIRAANAVSKLLSAPAEIGREMVDLPLESWKVPKDAAYPIQTGAELAAYGVVPKVKGGFRDLSERTIKTGKVEEAPYTEVPTGTFEDVATKQETVTEAKPKIEKPTTFSEEKLTGGKTADTVAQEWEVVDEATISDIPGEVKQFKYSDEAQTGIKNSVVDAERAAKGLDPIESPMRKLDPENWDKAKEAVENGDVDPRLLAQSIIEKPRNISPEETNALLYDKMRLQNEHRQVMDGIEEAQKMGNSDAEVKFVEQRDRIESDLNTLDMATKKAGTEWGLSGLMRQQMVAQDYSLSAILQRARADKGGEPLTTEERVKYESFAKQIEEAHKKIKEYEDRLSQKESDVVISKIRNEVAREKRQAKRTVAKQELDVEFQGLVKELNSVLGGQLNAGIDPAGAVILGKMAKNRVHSGIITAEGLVDHIYTELKNAGIELSKRDIRDAISGYGKTTQLSKEEINVKLRELRHQMRLVSALEDAQAKQVPLRSGLQRDLPSNEVRELQRKVQQAMRESGIDSASTRTPEQQWKTSLDAVKTRLKNQLADFVKQLETGEKTPKKIGIKYDEKANELKRIRDKVKEVLDFVENDKSKKEIPPEQKIRQAMAAVEKSIAEYERRIEESDLNPKKKTSNTPLTPELKELRKERDLLKDIYKMMKDEATPKKTPGEIVLQSFKTRTKNRIAELETKLSSKDFTSKPKRETRLDKEGLKLKFQLDQATRKYQEARFKDKLARRTVLEKLGATVGEIFQVSRAIKTSFDVSAVLRQGAFIVFGHPIMGTRSIPAMFEALRSKEGQFAIEQEIRNRANYPLYEQAKLYLSEHSNKLSDMEEMYMSRWAEHIPGVAASGRAYTTFLNKLRADAFDSMVQNLTSKGRPTLEESKAIANYINVATGRGKVGFKENTLVGLNSILFAPRYVASRFQILAGQPLYHGSVRTRVAIAKEYGRFLCGAATVYMLGKLAAGEIETDSRSSDFGKIKLGNTRLDPLGGLSQTTVLVSRLGVGETKTSKGEILPIRGDNVPFGKGDSADIIARFLRTKLAPIPGIGVDALSGKDVVGQKLSPGAIPEKLLMPLSFNDIYTTMKEEGLPVGIALGTLSLFGMGLQNYTPGKQTEETMWDTFSHDILGNNQDGETDRRLRTMRKRVRSR